MRVIARSTLSGFVTNRVERRLQKTLKAHLDVWFAEAERAQWKSSAEVKAYYRSSSILSSERVVFNIKGNDYRLIVAIDYAAQIVLIKWLGTHREYDKIDARGVAYDESRYANPADSISAGS